jgi:hypothetical protein
VDYSENANLFTDSGAEVKFFFSQVPAAGLARLSGERTPPSVGFPDKQHASLRPDRVNRGYLRP